VLVIKDPATLVARLAGMFSSKSLSELGKSATGRCPPPPPGFSKSSPTPAPGIAPLATSATAQPQSQGW
jgi:hypothetical protein